MGTLRSAAAFAVSCGLSANALASPSLRMRDDGAQASLMGAPVRWPAAVSSLPPPPPIPGVEPTPQSKVAPWTWYAIAAGCVVAGLAIDLGAGSSSNGKWDALDVVPPVLYVAGAGLVLKGRF